MNTGKKKIESEMSNIFHFHSQFFLPLGVTRGNHYGSFISNEALIIFLN